MVGLSSEIILSLCVFGGSLKQRPVFQLFKFEMTSFFTEMELQRQYCISMITRISPQIVNSRNMSQLLHSSKDLSVLQDTENSVLLATMANMLKCSCQDLKLT